MRSYTTQAATVASPIVWLTSKHSMRCTVSGTPSASCSAASRVLWVLCSVSFDLRACSAFCLAISNQARRSAVGRVTMRTLRFACSLSVASSSSVSSASPTTSAAGIGRSR